MAASVRGWFADLCVADVGRARDFYVALLELEVAVDHGWYVELGCDGRVVLALVLAGHETVPARSGTPPAGVLVSFEVADAHAVWSRAAALGCDAVHPLTDELGQRHFMVADPDGTIVDVIERIPLTTADRRALVRHRRAAAPASDADR